MKQSELTDYNISGAKSWFNCTVCNQRTARLDSELRQTDDPTCSVECRGKLQSQRQTGSNNPNWDGGKETLSCDSCGGPVAKDPATVREHNFCSRDCWGEFASENRVGEDNPAYASIEVECDECGSPKAVKPYRLENQSHHFCDMECRDKGFTGQSNPRWGGGASISDALRRLMGPRSWSHISEKFREGIDECYKCGKTPTDRALDVHHIVPMICGGTNAEELLMPLCGTCHKTVERYTKDFIDPVMIDVSLEGV